MQQKEPPLNVYDFTSNQSITKIMGKYYFDGIGAKLNEKKFHVKTSHSIEILFSLL